MGLLGSLMYTILMLLMGGLTIKPQWSLWRPSPKGKYLELVVASISDGIKVLLMGFFLFYACWAFLICESLWVLQLNQAEGNRIGALQTSLLISVSIMTWLPSLYHCSICIARSSSILLQGHVVKPWHKNHWMCCWYVDKCLLDYKAGRETQVSIVYYFFLKDGPNTIGPVQKGHCQVSEFSVLNGSELWLLFLLVESCPQICPVYCGKCSNHGMSPTIHRS